MASSVCRRNECRGCTPALRSGDATAARAWAEAAVERDLGGLRVQVAGLYGEVALAHLDSASLVARVAAAIVDGELCVCGGGAAPAMRPLARRQVAAAPASSSPAASSAPAPAAVAAAPAATASTFGPDVDVAAMVRALTDAARDGTPFCEECERARRQRAEAGR
jgi:hypothetical protein